MLSDRGSGATSRVGRPTGLKVASKKLLSESEHARSQRERMANANDETKALTAAGSADRQAKMQMKKKIEKTQEWKAADADEREDIERIAGERLADTRFAQKQSSKL